MFSISTQAIACWRAHNAGCSEIEAEASLCSALLQGRKLSGAPSGAMGVVLPRPSPLLALVTHLPDVRRDHVLTIVEGDHWLALAGAGIWEAIVRDIRRSAAPEELEVHAVLEQVTTALVRGEVAYARALCEEWRRIHQ